MNLGVKIAVLALVAFAIVAVPSASAEKPDWNCGSKPPGETADCYVLNSITWAGCLYSRECI